MTDDPLLTTEQAALLSGVSPATIRAWVARGILTPTLKVHGRNCFRLTDVDNAEHLARQRDVSGRSRRRLE